MWMLERDDNALLREYVDHDSQEAFATLVARHVNKVYSVALRHTGNPNQAEEITQAVFVILARKSRRLSKAVVLSGWLYQTARLTAVTFIRSEIRRAHRELEVHMQNVSNEDESDAWPQIAPLLDTAMAGLNETDRHAVVLRFFDGRSMREVGAALGATEDAAKKRVNRAVEKLRLFFTKRGVVLPAAVLMATISANSVQAAPTALASAIATAGVAKGVTASGSTLTLINGALKIMAWKQIKLAVAVGMAILATGAATVAARQLAQGAARIPYKMLDDAYQFIAGVNQSNLLLRMTFSSKQVSQPTNIHLTIESKIRGPIAVQLGNDGQLLNFPHDDALRRENPLVVSDLPKGSLTMTVAFQIPKPQELTFRYSRLTDGVAEINKAVDRANQMIKQSYAKEMLPFKKQVQAVNLIFPPASAGKAKLEVASTKGRREYTANARGMIKLKIEKALLEENPEVKVSQNLRGIVPDLE